MSEPIKDGGFRTVVLSEKCRLPLHIAGYILEGCTVPDHLTFLPYTGPGADLIFNLLSAVSYGNSSTSVDIWVISNHVNGVVFTISRWDHVT